MRSLLLALIIGGLGLSVGAQAQAAYLPMAGDLIKTAKSSAIYIVDDNLRRHLFPNEVTFWTWHTGGWANQKVKVITQDEFDLLENGKNVIARAGVNLIRFDNSNKVFAVTPGGVLCEVRALYGEDWMSRVITIQSAFETDYVKDNSCIVTSGGKYPDGQLIQYQNSKDIYLIDSGKKRKISAEAFALNKYKDTSVIRNVLATMTYTSGNAISNLDYNLGILYSLNYSRTQEITSRPDLVVSDVIFPPGKIVVNQAIDVKLIIKNIGGNLTLGNGLRNIIFSGQDWNTLNVTHSDYPSVAKPLLNNQTFEVTYNGKFIASGNKNFTVKIDEPSEIVEISESNNSFSKTVAVSAN